VSAQDDDWPSEFTFKKINWLEIGLTLAIATVGTILYLVFNS